MIPETQPVGDPQLRPPAGMAGVPGPLFRLIRDQRVAFLIVGGFNTAFGTAIFITALWLLPRGEFSYLGALLCAHVVSVLCAFVLYRRFVFRVTGHVWRDLARFELVNLSSLGFNLVALPALVELAGWPPIPAQFSIAGVQVIYSWFAHRGFSFRRSSAELAVSADEQQVQ